ncbi:MAG: alpha/beta hydrolase [Blastocatellia bacterium]
MSQETRHDDPSKKKVVYQLPDMDSVTIRRDVEYRKTDAGALTMDLYYPFDLKSEARAPAVIIVTGYPDPGFERMVGCRFKEMGSSVSWGQLMAASGLAAITYTNIEPAADLYALLDYVRQNAESLGLDETRIGLWASSGNVPLALSALMQETLMKCAALCYGYMLDLEGATGVAEAARRFGFVNPCAGREVDDLPDHLPLFIARAGQDELPHLNETLDLFLYKALACNLPITFANHAAAPHAFDLLHDSHESREIIRQILAFMKFHLLRNPD